jgi:hypothetical protein
MGVKFGRGPNTSGVVVFLYVLGMKETLLGASNGLRSEYVELVQCIELRTSVLQYSRTQIIRTGVIRIGLALRVNLSRTLQY